MFATMLEKYSQILKTRMHPEWRLITAVIVFSASSAFSTSFWKSGSVLSAPEIAGVVIGLLLVIIFYIWRKQRPHFVLILLMMLLAGASIGQYRILSLTAQTTIGTSFVSVTGTVERLEKRSNGLSRLLVNQVSFERAEFMPPDKIRVSIRTEIDENIVAGSIVRFTTKLAQPNGPVVPGGYNFAQSAFFSGISAEGIALSPISLVPKEKKTESKIQHYINNLRGVIERTLLENIPGQPGAIAVALTVGFRNHIDAKTREQLRRAGLSHLLAISGLHMGLVTATSFLFFEFFLAIIPSIGLRVMPKKIAVVPTWLVAVGYLFLSGASTATIRAFIMVSVALLAVMTDRKILSLRSVALAALFIVCIFPESVLSVSFQMSFAATTGLVCFYEAFGRRIIAFQGRKNNFFFSLICYLAAIATTSIVAQLAVAPLALYHFQTLSVVGVIANVVALPLISFFVMPLLFLGVFVAPIGGIKLVSGLIGYSLTLVLDVASEVSALSFAVIQMEPMFVAAIISISLCLIAIILIRHVFTRIVLFAGVLFSFAIGFKTPADILISKSGRIVATSFEGDYYSAGGRQRSFRSRIWRQYWGVDPGSVSGILQRVCTTEACGYDVMFDNTYMLTVPKRIGAVRRACSRNKIVILPQKYTRYCKGARKAITQEELTKKGPLAIHIMQDETIVLEWSDPQPYKAQ